MTCTNPSHRHDADDLVEAIQDALDNLIGEADASYNYLVTQYDKVVKVAQNLAVVLRLIGTAIERPELDIPIESFAQGLTDEAYDFFTSDEINAKVDGFMEFHKNLVDLLTGSPAVDAYVTDTDAGYEDDDDAYVDTIVGAFGDADNEAFLATLFGGNSIPGLQVFVVNDGGGIEPVDGDLLSSFLGGFDDAR